MTDPDQQRDDFLTELHELFLLKKGFGAYAYISTSEAMNLFEQYLDSDKPLDLFINQYIKTIKG